MSAVRAVAPVCVGVVSRRTYATDYPDHEVISMPALSPTMEQGTIVTWNVAVGDEVSAGDSLADVETDKATMSFDSGDDGYVAKFLVDEGKGCLASTELSSSARAHSFFLTFDF
jgi:pyruvate dehydrogenase E2 component (dihydrolipoamide acetyltransferase)